MISGAVSAELGFRYTMNPDTAVEKTYSVVFDILKGDHVAEL